MDDSLVLHVTVWLLNGCGWVMQELYVCKDPASGKLLHVMSSGIKAGATWVRAETLQHCRECCGGQGFLAANKIGPMKNDMVRHIDLPTPKDCGLGRN